MKKLIIAAIMLITIASTANAWWNNTFQYRHELNLTSSTTTLTDFQTKIILNSTNIDYTATNNDGSDLRFTWYNATSGEEQEIPYWIDNQSEAGWNESGNSYVWIKAPIIDTEGETFYYYYGNTSTVQPKTNGNNVFSFFDDFDGTTLNTTKWYIEQEGGTYTVQNGYLNLTVNGGVSQKMRIRHNETSFIQDSLLYLTKVRRQTENTYWSQNNVFYDTNGVELLRTWTSRQKELIRRGGLNNYGQYDIDTTIWHDLTIKTNTTWFAMYYDNLLDNETTGSFQSFQNFSLKLAAAQEDADYDSSSRWAIWSYIAIGKYSADTTTATYGEKEAIGKKIEIEEPNSYESGTPLLKFYLITGDSNYYNITYKLDGTTIHTFENIQENTTQTYNITGLTDGEHTVYLEFESNSTNNATKTFIYDNTAPVLTINHPNARKPNEEVILNYTATSLSGIANQTWTIEALNGTTNYTSESLSLNFTEAQIVNITLTATSNSGLTNTTTATIYIAEITITSPGNYSSGEETLTFQTNMYDTNEHDINYYLDGTLIKTIENVTNGTTTSTAMTIGTEGSHTIKLEIDDNTYIYQEHTFIYDNTAPVLEININPNPSWPNHNTTINYTATSYSGIANQTWTINSNTGTSYTSTNDSLIINATTPQIVNITLTATSNSGLTTTNTSTLYVAGVYLNFTSSTDGWYKWSTQDYVTNFTGTDAIIDVTNKTGYLTVVIGENTDNNTSQTFQFKKEENMVIRENVIVRDIEYLEDYYIKKFRIQSSGEFLEDAQIKIYTKDDSTNTYKLEKAYLTGPSGEAEIPLRNTITTPTKVVIYKQGYETTVKDLMILTTTETITINIGKETDTEGSFFYPTCGDKTLENTTCSYYGMVTDTPEVTIATKWTNTQTGEIIGNWTFKTKDMSSLTNADIDTTGHAGQTLTIRIYKGEVTEATSGYLVEYKTKVVTTIEEEQTTGFGLITNWTTTIRSNENYLKLAYFMLFTIAAIIGTIIGRRFAGKGTTVFIITLGLFATTGFPLLWLPIIPIVIIEIWKMYKMND